jgi:AcrR family transcriptional regulator
MAGPKSEDRVLDAALGLLQVHGPASQRLGLSVAEASRISGLHRSSLYRRFSTAAELNDAVTVWLAAGPDDWRGHLCAQPVDAPLDVVLPPVLRNPLQDLGPTVRGLVVGWDETHPVRRPVVVAERARLAELAGWLDRHLEAHGRQVRGAIGPLGLAQTVSAMVEGQSLQWVHASRHERTQWEGVLRPALVRRVARVVEHASEPRTIDGADPAVPEVRDALVEVDPVVDRFLAAEAHHAYQWRPEPRRLVDLGRLARQVGVSERRVYDLWPTAESMNAAVCIEVLRRRLLVQSDLASTKVDRYLNDPDLAQLLEGFSDLIRNAFEHRANYFAVLPALWDPRLRLALEPLLVQWMSESRRAFLATQAALGVSRRTGVDATELTATLRTTSLGFLRLVGLHPELGGRPAELTDPAAPDVGRLLGQVASSMIS